MGIKENSCFMVYQSNDRNKIRNIWQGCGRCIFLIEHSIKLLADFISQIETLLVKFLFISQYDPAGSYYFTIPLRGIISPFRVPLIALRIPILRLHFIISLRRTGGVLGIGHGD